MHALEGGTHFCGRCLYKEIQNQWGSYDYEYYLGWLIAVVNKLLGSHIRKGMDSQYIRLTGQIPHVATAQQ